MRFLLLLLLFAPSAFAQFAPPAGLPGSTAIPKDTAVISGWATGATLVRGYRQVNLPDSGYASVGDAASVVGPAGENGVASLGDGGSAILTFANPISDGDGFDFCVFENSFQDDFLELAFVEVSSDGVHFVRFPSTSLTQDTQQTPSFGLTDATKVDGLAGKYRAGFGTPFDLGLLKDSDAVDVQHITHVKVVDVVGAIDSTLATFDSHLHKVNDPWPTNFPSSGFDLDAVAVLAHWPAAISAIHNSDVVLWPNPFSTFVLIPPHATLTQVTDAVGRTMEGGEGHEVHTTGWSSGIYYFHIMQNGAPRTFKMVKQ